MHMNSKIISRTEIGIKSYRNIIHLYTVNFIKTDNLIKRYYVL